MKNLTRIGFAWICLAAVSSYLTAAVSTDDTLRQEYDELKKTLQELNAKLENLESKIASIEDNPPLPPPPAPVSGVLDNAYAGDSVYHISGYTDAGFYGSDGGDGSFATGAFAPIVHYQYKDLVLFGGELAFLMESGPNGETITETELEYLSMDLLLSDYAALVVGKFLSPAGQFVQNIHPSWINKLPSAPIGFGAGHGGSQAVPISEIGMQLRGGMLFSDKRFNYAVFVGNGPAMLVEEGQDGLEVEGIDTTGRLDSNGNYSTGGRIGFLPIPNLEIGASIAMAKASVSNVAGHGDEEGEVIQEGFINDRDYLFYGMDFYYSPKALRRLVFRGEYARTSLGAGSFDEADPDENVWEAWYVQASYAVENSRLEPVFRYGKYDDPHGEKLTQWAIGLNYLFSGNLIGKLAYEINDSNEEVGAANQYGLQLAYGF